MAPDETAVDDDLDACDTDFTDDAVDEDTQELLPLFPDGVADDAKAKEWRDLATAAGKSWLPDEARFVDEDDA